VIAAIALIAMMVQLGLALEPSRDRTAKRHERWLLLRALLFNFAMVPLLAELARSALGAAGPVAIALALLSASPGGRHAPWLAEAARADAELSVEVTLFANKLNVFLSPLLAAWLLGKHRVGVHELPYIIQLVVLQILPFFGARQLRKRRPTLAARLARPAQRTGIAAMLVLLVYLITRHALRATLSFGVRGWVAVLLFGVVLLALGWLVGGPDPAARRAFAIVGETRNLALALVMASSIVGDDQVLLAIFGAWVILFALGWIAVALFRMRQLPIISTRAPVPSS
jgi:BASS family bile acid:Na+ symporter